MTRLGWKFQGFPHMSDTLVLLYVVSPHRSLGLPHTVESLHSQTFYMAADFQSFREEKLPGLLNSRPRIGTVSLLQTSSGQSNLGHQPRFKGRQTPCLDRWKSVCIRGEKELMADILGDYHIRISIFVFGNIRGYFPCFFMFFYTFKSFNSII